MSLTKLSPRVTIIDTRKGATIAVGRIRGWKLTKIRDRILLRDMYSCVKCGRMPVNISDLEVDHIIPLHLGGSESDENRQTLCVKCHEAKNAEEGKARGR